MKANTRTTLKKDENAEVGIGTMIVFIATVLVAAVAASVLIDVSSSLQEKSSRTGSQATEKVASNLEVTSIFGNRSATGDTELQVLELYVSLAPGASEIDLTQLKIQVLNSTKLATYDHSATMGASNFTVASVRDSDSSMTNDVMTSGDLAKITIGANATISVNLPVRTDVVLSLIPEIGNPTSVGFSTPPAFGQDLIFELA